MSCTNIGVVLRGCTGEIIPKDHYSFEFFLRGDYAEKHVRTLVKRLRLPDDHKVFVFASATVTDIPSKHLAELFILIRGYIP